MKKNEGRDERKKEKYKGESGVGKMSVNGLMIDDGRERTTDVNAVWGEGDKQKKKKEKKKR